MKVISLILLLFTLSFSQAEAVFNMLDATQAGDSKSGGKANTTEGEFGILGSLAGVYNKGREAVKTTYDEIQYWKGIIGTYGKMKTWYEEQKAGFKRIGRTFGAVFSDPKQIFSAIERGEFDDISGKIFGDIDYKINIAPEKLNNIFGSAEKLMSAGDPNKFGGAIMPNTGKVYNEFNAIVLNTNMKIDFADEFSLNKKIIENSNKIYNEANVETMPEYKIMETIKAMAASATENSQNYTAWAAQTTGELNKKIDSVNTLFDAGYMDNIMDLQLLAAMNELEMVNANNKRIMHELELLKAHHAILGVEIWKHNKDKTDKESFVANSLTMKSSLQVKLDEMKKP